MHPEILQQLIELLGADPDVTAIELGTEELINPNGLDHFPMALVHAAFAHVLDLPFTTIIKSDPRKFNAFRKRFSEPQPTPRLRDLAAYACVVIDALHMFDERYFEIFQSDEDSN